MDYNEDNYNEDEDYYNHEEEETPEKVYADVQLDDTIPSYLRDVATNKGKYYLTNEDLLPEVLKSVAAGKISERLGKMLLLLTDRYSRKFSFVRYSYREDMVGYALINLCKTALKFNPERSSNPFAYYTQAIKNSFIQYMLLEKREHYIRDELLVKAGEEPSAGYEENIIKRRLAESEEIKKNKKNKESEDYFTYDEE
jgi:DNA-directed RNA polymerase specialized sigma subunit